MSHGGGRGKGRGRGGHEEEHENHERWAVSYADMMTVLMALFLVLFAMSNVDQKKYLELKTSLANGFGNQVLPTDGGSGIVDGSTGSAVDVGNGLMNGESLTVSTTVASASQAEAVEAAAQEAQSLRELQEQLQEQLEAQGLQDQVTSTITERGLVVSVAANNIFFANGSAAIEPAGASVVDAIAPVLRAQTSRIAVEGHANSLALSSGSQYANNWDLSYARASSVLLRLLADGVDGKLLRAVGFGDTLPLYPDGDPRALEGNRRVDIVLESASPDAVKELLPEAAAEAATGAAPEAVPDLSADAAPDLGADAAPSLSH